MKSIKKFLFSLLSLSFLVISCQNKQVDENKVVEIEYWHVASESFGGPAVKKLIENFNQKNPNIKVVEKFNPDMYKGLTQNLQISLAAKKYPDVVQIGYSYLNYVNDNFDFASIPSVISENFPEDKDFLKNNFLENILSLGKIEDKQVGIPYSISNPIMYVNADLFKQAGLNPDNLPKTWTQVYESSKLIKQKTNNFGLFMQEYSDNWAQQALMESNGGKIIEYVNKKTIPVFASDESAYAYQFLADMVKEGLAVHANNDEGFQAFLNGKIAMVITTIGKRAHFEKSANFDLRAVEFPTFEGKKRKVPSGGNMLIIMSKDREKQKASWEFIKYLLSDEASEIWTKGTGYLPPTIQKEGTEIQKFLNENKLMKAAINQMPDVVKWASFSGSNGLKAEQILIDTRDVILSGQKSAKQALKEAQDEITNLMK